MDAIAFGSIIGQGKQADENPHLSGRTARFPHYRNRGASAQIVAARAAVEGFRCRGFNSNASQRQELQGAPKFTGLIGPMWDGDAIRYECSATYAELSA
jgi:hypothetical protein